MYYMCFQSQSMTKTAITNMVVGHNIVMSVVLVNHQK